MSVGRVETDTGGWAVWTARLWPGAGWLLLALVAGGLAFHDGFAALARVWQLPEYSHGPLIPLISLYLLLRHMRQHPAHLGPVTDRGTGLALMFAALLLGLLGQASGIDEIVTYALILWAGGLVLTSFGWRRGWVFWPAILHLVFMLPLPGILHYKTTAALQLVASELGVGVIAAAGIPVALDGNIIVLEGIQLHVAEACSGLRYLFPVLSFTYLFAVLYRGPLWAKAVLCLAAVPLTVMMNAARIGMIGIMADQVSPAYAEGLMHIFEGWTVFLLTIALMVGLSALLLWVSGDRRGLLAALDLDMTGLGAELARVGDVRPSRALLGGTAALALGGIVALAAPALGLAPKAEPVTRDPFVLFPSTLGPWETIGDRSLAPEIAETLGADDYLWRHLRAEGAAEDVDLFVAWYADQRQGGIHSPEICLPGAGWEIAALTRTEIDTGAGTIPVNRAVIQNGRARQLVYYWFDQRGRRLTLDYAAKAWLVWDGAATGRTDGALIRLVTPILPEDGEAGADARLTDALGPLMARLPGFIDTTWPPEE